MSAANGGAEEPNAGAALLRTAGNSVRANEINYEKKNDDAVDERKQGKRIELASPAKRKRNYAHDPGCTMETKEEAMKKKKKADRCLDANGASSSSHPATALASTDAFCSFPLSRVWRLVRGACGHATAAEIRTTGEAVFLINKTAEMFLELFTEDAHAIAQRERKKSISYNHLLLGWLLVFQSMQNTCWSHFELPGDLCSHAPKYAYNLTKSAALMNVFIFSASTVNSVKRYEFLSDFVPEKVRAEDALKERSFAQERT
ncbi:hypothetical protein AXF42_Ash017405 [Apostasia shenzhenica]|uniref:Transcription factor CBF/NF-Y/archaeal histone domain-containing protein n=1 Tax=Apostasia shenzhenica TaxID=1088818 RepID=A0A2H9ZZ01_9ASPA|nr:hypothetical protein AXF42_Ash017405 [Apostasia shenzhenica]